MTNIYPLCKRVFDFFAAVVIFIIASPVILLMMALVKMTSRGPVIYSQKRVGLHGQEFFIYKIRTMYQDAESRSGPKWATEHDPRITPLGRFLRKSHLDELPQLWNILRGEMSLVGPRPERPEFTVQLEKVIPHYSERLAMKSGVTGLAQILLPPDTDVLSVRRKLSCDLYYVEHADLWLDLRILMITGLGLIGIKYPVGCRLFFVPDHDSIGRNCKVVRMFETNTDYNMGHDSDRPVPVLPTGPICVN